MPGQPASPRPGRPNTPGSGSGTSTRAKSRLPQGIASGAALTGRPNDGDLTTSAGTRHHERISSSEVVGRPGLEPGTYGLKEACCGAPSALPARKPRECARKAPNAQSIRRHSVHDSFHGTGAADRDSVTERSGDQLWWARLRRLSDTPMLDAARSSDDKGHDAILCLPPGGSARYSEARLIPTISATRFAGRSGCRPGARAPRWACRAWSAGRAPGVSCHGV